METLYAVQYRYDGWGEKRWQFLGVSNDEHACLEWCEKRLTNASPWRDAVSGERVGKYIRGVGESGYPMGFSVQPIELNEVLKLK